MFLRMLKTIYTLLKKIAVSNQIKTTCNTRVTHFFVEFVCVTHEVTFFVGNLYFQQSSEVHFFGKVEMYLNVKR